MAGPDASDSLNRLLPDRERWLDHKSVGGNNHTFAVAAQPAIAGVGGLPRRQRHLEIAFALNGQIQVITDDERPFIVYGDDHQTAKDETKEPT